MTSEALAALVRVIDGYAGRYRERSGADGLAGYLSAPGRADDEETITEPVLADLLEQVLGFPKDAYFPQLSKSPSKPDFTPTDLVAHPFVLDAKSSLIGDLDAHEPQIRRYIDQRGLRHGVLFNLRELRVYRRGARGHDPELSFQLLPLWQVARGEALPGGEVERFVAFVEQFRHRALGAAERVAMVSRAESWRQLEARGERLIIDVAVLHAARGDPLHARSRRADGVGRRAVRRQRQRAPPAQRARLRHRLRLLPRRGRPPDRRRGRAWLATSKTGWRRSSAASAAARSARSRITSQR